MVGWGGIMNDGGRQSYFFNKLMYQEERFPPGVLGAEGTSKSWMSSWASPATGTPPPPLSGLAILLKYNQLLLTHTPDIAKGTKNRLEGGWE